MAHASHASAALASWVNDEGKPVSFAWLARELGVPAEQAKG